MHLRALWGAAAVLCCGGVLASCGEPTRDAAPVFTALPGPGTPGTAPAKPSPRPPMKTRSIVVQPGQSLGGLAEAHHVSKRALIGLNHLQPPYELKIGQHLVIPIEAAAEHATRPAPATKTAASSERPHRAKKPNRAEPEIIPLDDPAPARAASPVAGSASVGATVPQ